jgi:hypothetical protein
MKQWFWIITFGSACAILFFLAYGHIWLIERDWLWIRDKLVRRTGSITDQRKAFTWTEWSWISLLSAARLFTIPVLLLTLGWMIARMMRRPRDSRAATLVILLLGWAALHVLIGRQGVYQHQWWWWPLAPAASVAAALFVDRFAPRRRAFDVAIVALLIALAAWSTTTSWLALHKPPGMSDDPNSHSIADIGRAIRTSVPPDTAVMLAEKDETTGLWYYADRPIVVDIWTVDGFLNRHVDPGTADLPFGFTEQWHKPTQRFIFPKIYVRFAEPLLHYLQSHYAAYDAPPDVKQKFYVFDLTRPLL